MMSITLMGMLGLVAPVVGAALAWRESRWTLLVGVSRSVREAGKYWRIAAFGAGALAVSWAASGSGAGMLAL